MISLFFTRLFWLVFGHMLADYPLQTDFIAKGKNRNTAIPGVPWYYIMTAHAFMHGGAVGLFTGSMVLAFAETVVHFFIDVAKCEGYTNIHVDQALHIVCKLLWVILLLTGVV